MPSRTAKILSAIFVNILAGIPLMTMARGEPANAETCLSSPKAETPQGSHWRYRIDHVNKRNCWYLRHEDGGLSQAQPQSSPAASAPMAKPSIADARAEFRPQTSRDDNSAVTSPPPSDATGSETNSPNGSVWSATAAVATRWPELPAARSVPNAAPAAAGPVNDVTQPAADPVPVASPPSSPFAFLSLAGGPEMIPTLFAATAGALAFAGAAALISRRRRRTRLLRQAHDAGGAVWETTDDDRIVLSEYPSMEDQDYLPRFARGAGNAAASDHRAPEFIRRMPWHAAR